MIKRRNIDFIFILILTISPFLFYSYKLFPENTNKIEFLFIIINSGSDEEIQHYMWVIAVKILTITFCSVWFITSKKNLIFYSLIVTLLVEIYKLASIFHSDFIGHSHQYFFSLLYSVPFLLILFYIKKVIGYHLNSFSKELNLEINQQLLSMTKPSLKSYERMQKQIQDLRKDKLKIDEREYLINLIKLRDQLTDS